MNAYHVVAKKELLQEDKEWFNKLLKVKCLKVVNFRQFPLPFKKKKARANRWLFSQCYHSFLIKITPPSPKKILKKKKSHHLLHIQSMVHYCGGS